MQNRITVNILGRTYTLISEDDPEYVQRCAAHVDKVMKDTAAPTLSQVDCAVLSALNIADELYREKAREEELRRELMDLMNEAGALNVQLSEAKRQIFKLQQKR